MKHSRIIFVVALATVVLTGCGEDPAPAPAPSDETVARIEDGATYYEQEHKLNGETVLCLHREGEAGAYGISSHAMSCTPVE